VAGDGVHHRGIRGRTRHPPRDRIGHSCTGRGVGAVGTHRNVDRGDTPDDVHGRWLQQEDNVVACTRSPHAAYAGRGGVVSTLSVAAVALATERTVPASSCARGGVEGSATIDAPRGVAGSLWEYAR
jgi:hypothetical protein